MQYIIDIPEELVTEHQLKLILTKEIRSGRCHKCKTRCIECVHISVREFGAGDKSEYQDNYSPLEIEGYKDQMNDIARKRSNV